MQQSDWQFCNKCEGLFYAGDTAGVCPAGGAHDDRTSGGYVLSDPESAQPGQSGWKCCRQCNGLFFTENNMGVCPTHTDAGSGEYVLPTSGAGQSGWRGCSKCQGVFFAVNGLGVCAAGGSHDDTGMDSFVIPLAGSGQSDWRWCSKCQGIFFAGGSLGACPAGGTHTYAGSSVYVLPQSGAGLGPYRWCNQCQGLFFGGIVGKQGVCPAPQAHVAAGNDGYVLSQSGAGQTGWNWCNKCQGLFFASAGPGVCPSRVGEPTNQPSAHDATGGGGYVLTPLGSNKNYVLSDNDSALLAVGVTITVTQDIVFASGSSAGAGFSFQLNAYSPNSQTAVGWQQYIIDFDGINLYGKVENWPLNPPSGSYGFVNYFVLLKSLQTPNRIPAGYSLSIMLDNGDDKGDVTGVKFVVLDNLGNTLANPHLQLTTLPLSAGSGLLTPANLAPIVAFELDIVGPENAESVVLSSGAGTILYGSSNTLTPSNQVPAFAASSNTGTAEAANTVYGTLSPSPNTFFAQSFSVTE